MKNYETSGSKIVALNERDKTVPFVHNEDYTMVARVVGKDLLYGKLIGYGVKLWDKSSTPKSFTFAVKYTPHNVLEPDLNAIIIGEEVVLHRVGEYNGIGVTGYEYHESDDSKCSWVCYIPVKANVSQLAVIAWDVTNGIDRSRGELVSIGADGAVIRGTEVVWIDYLNNPVHLKSIGDSTVYNVKKIRSDITKDGETHDLYIVTDTFYSNQEQQPFYVKGTHYNEYDLNVTFVYDFTTGLELQSTIAGVVYDNKLVALIDSEWIGETGTFQYARVISTFPLTVAPIEPIVAVPQIGLYMDVNLTNFDRYIGEGVPPLGLTRALYRKRYDYA